MTHRINLRDWESAGLLAGRITALCRVVRPQPFNGNVCVIQHRDQWLMAMTCDKLPIAHPPLISPFGAPGDVVLGRECWRYVDFEIDGGFANCAIEYRDGARAFDRKAGNTDAMLSLRCGWRSSTTQPDWAIRHRLTTKSVRCVRIREMDALTALKLGTQFASDKPRWSFVEQFDRDNPKTPYADNPWVWVGEFNP